MVWITNNTLNNSLLPHYIKSALSLLLLPVIITIVSLMNEWSSGIQRWPHIWHTANVWSYFTLKAFIEVLYVGQFADAMPSLFVVCCDVIITKWLVLRDFFSCGTHTGWRRDWDRRFWSIEESACLSGEERKFVLAVSRGRFDNAARCNSVFGRAPAALC